LLLFRLVKARQTQFMHRAKRLYFRKTYLESNRINTLNQFIGSCPSGPAKSAQKPSEKLCARWVITHQCLCLLTCQHTATVDAKKWLTRRASSHRRFLGYAPHHVIYQEERKKATCWKRPFNSRTKKLWPNLLGQGQAPKDQTHHVAAFCSGKVVRQLSNWNAITSPRPLTWFERETKINPLFGANALHVQMPSSRWTWKG